MGPLNLVRQTLQRALPFETYLRVLSAGFLAPDRLDLFAPIHARVRFLRRLIRPGDVCVDVGANLGYFTVPLSRLVGPAGRVYAVEPVASFRTVLRANVRAFGHPDRVAVLPVALGPDDHAEVRLATAEVNGIARHGMTEVVQGQAPHSRFTHTATMRRPDTLFAHLNRLDFLKVDIEGFEIEVMPLFADLIAAHQPVLEIEAGSDASVEALRTLIEPLGYQTCLLHENGLVPLDEAMQRGGPADRDHPDRELYFWPHARRG
ncbi:MAG: FkbM family methyltransferase [Bacteroidota bacterium]